VKIVAHPGKGRGVEIGRERDKGREHCNQYDEPFVAEVFLVSIRSLAFFGYFEHILLL
jgi:hypothetical protein